MFIQTFKCKTLYGCLPVGAARLIYPAGCGPALSCIVLVLLLVLVLEANLLQSDFEDENEDDDEDEGKMQGA